MDKERTKLIQYLIIELAALSLAVRIFNDLHLSKLAKLAERVCLYNLRDYIKRSGVEL